MFFRSCVLGKPSGQTNEVTEARQSQKIISLWPAPENIRLESG